jgi:hypothetical protein
LTRRLPLNFANFKIVAYQFYKHFSNVKVGRDFMNKLAKFCMFNLQSGYSPLNTYLSRKSCPPIT